MKRGDRMLRKSMAVLTALLCLTSAVSAADTPFAASVEQSGRWGAVDENGKVVIPIRYDKIDLSLDSGNKRDDDLNYPPDDPICRTDLIEVSADGKRGFYDRSGQVIVPLSYEDRSRWTDGSLAAGSNGRFGFYSRDGKVISSMKYRKVSDFNEDMAAVSSGDKYGFINKDGEKIIPEVYEEVRPFSEGMAAVKKDGKWGAVDIKGNIAVPFLYTETGSGYSNGLLAAKKDNAWGFIDKKGNVTVPFIYKQEEPCFHEDRAAVQDRNGKWGFVDSTGRVIIPPSFAEVLSSFSEGLAGVRTVDGPACIDPSGKIVFTGSFDTIYPFHNGIAEFRRLEATPNESHFSVSFGFGWIGGGHYRYHGYRGYPGWYPTWHISPVFYDPWYWGGMIPLNGAPEIEIHRGYIDKAGHVIADSALDHVYPISNLGILVRNKGRFGWVNLKGEYVAHMVYENLLPLSADSLLLAQNNQGKWGALSSIDGTEKISFSYDELRDGGSGFLLFRQKSIWGILSPEGKMIAAASYLETGQYHDGLIPVRDAGGWKYLCTAGTPAFSLSGNVQEATDFTDGRAGVKIGGRWGLIDEKGSFIIAPEYDSMHIL